MLLVVAAAGGTFCMTYTNSMLAAPAVLTLLPCCLSCRLCLFVLLVGAEVGRDLMLALNTSWPINMLTSPASLALLPPCRILPCVVLVVAAAGHAFFLQGLNTSWPIMMLTVPAVRALLLSCRSLPCVLLVVAAAGRT